MGLGEGEDGIPVPVAFGGAKGGPPKAPAKLVEGSVGKMPQRNAAAAPGGAQRGAAIGNGRRGVALTHRLRTDVRRGITGHVRP